MEKTPKVIIVWGFSKEFGTINTLNSYCGVRVYEKDKLDSRVTMGGENPPYFRNAHEALEFLKNNPGISGMCQLDTRAASAFGFTKDEFESE
jgi:hypothetical protein